MSLSSCEAELHAIQAGVQESIGLARTLAFVLKSLNLREDLAPLADLEEGECPLNIQLRTDSLSGKQLLESLRLATTESSHRDTSVLASPTSE